MKYPKRSQHKYAKSPYRIRNWPEYEAGLRRRGDLTIWFSDDAIKSWRAVPSGKAGGQRSYASIAIEAAPLSSRRNTSSLLTPKVQLPARGITTVPVTCTTKSSSSVSPMPGKGASPG